MDESWRMRIGLTQGLPRRLSMDDSSSSGTRRMIFPDGSVSILETLDAGDFADVFGGPPRSLLAHKFSRSNSFYEEIFQQPVFASPTPPRSGRILPVFEIPAKNDLFYRDIFESEDDRKSRDRSGSQSKTKSKSNSSSVLSSEELSPLRPAIGGDVALSAFSSKLRPINVPYRWNSSTMMPEEQQPIKQKRSLFQCNGQSVEIQCQDNEDMESFKSSHFGFSRRVPSPETISVQSKPYQSIKVSSTDDWELSSPFSAVSRIFQEPDANSSVHDHVLPGLVIDEDEDEVMSSYVIEINSNLRQENFGTEDIDEAIAWAKEKFQSQNSNKESDLRYDGNEKTSGVEGKPCEDEYHEEHRIIGTVESSKMVQKETEKLDRDIRLWSSGKETNIRLLLSTLHDILWPESGWYYVPYMSLIESSQVKKAYQRARLCLHPDKLQQRGATLIQKYIAEKAFSILQDAWTAFISEDVSF